MYGHAIIYIYILYTYTYVHTYEYIMRSFVWLTFINRRAHTLLAAAAASIYNLCRNEYFYE